MKWLTSDNVLGDFDDVGLFAELGWVVIFILGEVQTSTTAWVNVLNNEKMLMLLKKEELLKLSSHINTEISKFGN